MHTLTSESLPGAFGLRALLIGSVAGALALAAAAPAQAGPDACVGVGGPNVTCTGNQSDGVALGPPGEVFNVNSLTTNIAPPLTTAPGIFIFRIGGDITLDSATGPFEIIAIGGTNYGVSVRNFGAGLNIVNHSGTITSEGIGLDSQSFDAASVINVNTTSDITANNNAIDILAGNNVSVISSGDLNSAASFGIQAQSVFNAPSIRPARSMPPARAFRPPRSSTSPSAPMATSSGATASRRRATAARCRSSWTARSRPRPPASS